jgi:hypothetical protein
MRKPVSLSELSLQFSVTLPSEPTVAERFDGAAGAFLGDIAAATLL